MLFPFISVVKWYNALFTILCESSRWIHHLDVWIFTLQIPDAKYWVTKKTFHRCTTTIIWGWKKVDCDKNLCIFLGACNKPFLFLGLFFSCGNIFQSLLPYELIVGIVWTEPIGIKCSIRRMHKSTKRNSWTEWKINKEKCRKERQNESKQEGNDGF